MRSILVAGAATAGPPARIRCGPGHERVPADNGKRRLMRRCERISTSP